jgi:PPOX class probable F420-dependent enzyme
VPHEDHDPVAGMTPEARALLEGGRVGRLATVDARGAPHVVPVCFALFTPPDGAVRIYSVVDEKPKRTTRLQRVRNIEAQPQVAFVVDRYAEDWSELAWVMVRGSAQVLDGGEEYCSALAALRAKYEQYRSMDLEGRPLIRLVPQRVNGWNAS